MPLVKRHTNAVGRPSWRPLFFDQISADFNKAGLLFLGGGALIYYVFFRNRQ